MIRLTSKGNLKKGAKNIDFVIDTSKIKVGSKASTRSMNYRTVRLDRFDKDAATTMITLYHDKNNMSEFPVKATFESGVVNTVTTAVHFTIPMASQWTAGGSVSRSTGSGLGQHWYNTAIGTKHDGIECQTLFRYVHEVWEYQRQDDDIYDLWHTEEQWVEVKVKEHRGSTMYGNKVHSSKNLKSFSSVGAGSYGAHHLITAPGGQSVFYSSSKVYSAAAKYTAPTGLLPYGITGDISLTASIGYNSKLTLEYGGPNQIHNKRVYDYNSGGSDWYVSQNQ